MVINFIEITMIRFPILLIDNQISVTAQVVSGIGQYLTEYTLTIIKGLAEAITQPEQPQVILLNINLLGDDASNQWAELIAAYPGTPIMLLVPQPALDSNTEKNLLHALSRGASDYYDLSTAGLFSLGRRLAALQNNWLHRPISNMLCQAIANDTSQLAIQMFDLNNRVKAWNQAAEAFFGIKQKDAVGRLIDELPLSVNNLSRLKDVLDQVRSTKQPFFIPFYHLENQQLNNPQTVHVQVYPIYNPFFNQSQSFEDICIIIQSDTGELRYNEDLKILLEASRGMSEHLELAPTLEKVVEQTRLLLNGESCQIYFLEKDNKTLRPVLAVGPLSDQIQATPLTIGQGMLGKIAADGKAVFVNSINADIEIPYSVDDYLLCAPLTAVGGTIGLIIVSRRSKTFSKDDLYFFETLIQQASSAINNARLFEETARSLNELATLYEASMAISTHWDDQDVLNTLIAKAIQAIDADQGFIASWDQNRNKGLVEAEYSSNSKRENTEQENIRPFGPVIELSNRENYLSMLNQQRPLFLHVNSPSLEATERSEMQKVGCLSKLLIPLVTKGQTIGWIELWNTQREHTFSPDEVRLSRALASQIAVALQNNQYLKQTQRTLEETTALYRVASELTTLQDPQTIMSIVLQEYLQALNLNQGSVVIFDFIAKCGIVKVRIQDETPAKFMPANGGRSQEPNYKILEGQQIPLQNNPIYEQLMRTHQPVVINSSQNKESRTLPTNPNLLSASEWVGSRASAVLVMPIKIREEVVGALVAENTRNALPFDKWAVSLGQAMADQLGIGLQNVELYESEYLRREQAETLRQVSSIVGSSLKLNEVLELILDQLARVIKYDSAAIHLVEGNHRRVIAGRGFKDPADHIGLVFPIQPEEDEPGSIAIYTRQPLVYDDISEVNESFQEPRHQHIRSWIGIPLIVRDKVIGLISIDHKEVGAYTEDDVHLAQAFANQVAIALENARLYAFEIQEIERELDFAQEIQETLLPQFIPQVPDLDIAGRIVPARQVGGDFFHFFSTDPEQLGVAIGDVSGKGIPAALYMAAGITAIDIQTDPDIMPGELLNKLNRKLYNRLQENRMNIALQVATFIPLPDPANVADKAKAKGSIMTVASAGMIAPIGATEHGCRLLPVSGFPIGALPAPQHEYMDEVFLLDPFTTIIFTSDGIVEAQNELGELFGFERLEKTILEIVGTREAAVIAEHIVDSAQAFMGKAEQHDDMTVVVVVKK